MKKIWQAILIFSLVLFLTITTSFLGIAQDQIAQTAIQEQTSKKNAIDGFPVLLDGEPIFVVREGVGSFSAEERARAIADRLERIARDDAISLDNIKVETSDQNNLTYLIFNEEILLTVTPQDAKTYRATQEEIAKEALSRIKAAIELYRNTRKPAQLLRSVIFTVLATIALLIISFLIIKTSGNIFPKIRNLIASKIPTLRIQDFEIISTAHISFACLRIFQLTRLFIILTLVYTYATFVLSLYPWTRAFSRSILNHLFVALNLIGAGIAKYLPNILMVILITVITYYIIRCIKPFFTAIERGTLIIPGFYADWAQPTYNLLLFLIIALAAVIVFPYLPGFDSPAFRGISVFLGILFSLGSTSAISNVVGGIILIYTRAFQVGDRISIGDVVGDVIEKTLLVVRIRTQNNKVITIPNSSLLSSNVINFSVSCRELKQPLIIQTTITLGYDLPWRKVHETLIKAALETKYIVPEPAPFVLQTSLDDFYVSYQLNAYTERPNYIVFISSELHENIQDKCNEVGIEIMSPHYRALRDGNQSTIPENYLPSDYTAPPFRVQPLDDGKN